MPTEWHIISFYVSSLVYLVSGSLILWSPSPSFSSCNSLSSSIVDDPAKVILVLSIPFSEASEFSWTLWLAFFPVSVEQFWSLHTVVSLHPISLSISALVVHPFHVAAVQPLNLHKIWKSLAENAHFCMNSFPTYDFHVHRWWQHNAMVIPANLQLLPALSVCRVPSLSLSVFTLFISGSVDLSLFPSDKVPVTHLSARSKTKDK